MLGTSEHAGCSRVPRFAPHLRREGVVTSCPAAGGRCAAAAPRRSRRTAWSAAGLRGVGAGGGELYACYGPTTGPGRERGRILPPLAEAGLDIVLRGPRASRPGRRATAAWPVLLGHVAGLRVAAGARRRRDGSDKVDPAHERDVAGQVVPGGGGPRTPGGATRGRTRRSSRASTPWALSRSLNSSLSTQLARRGRGPGCAARPRTSTPRAAARPSTASTSLLGSPVSRSSASPCQSAKTMTSPGPVPSMPSWSRAK